MATKLITLVPNLSTEEIQAMIDTKIDETDLVANLDFQNHLTAANPHGITPAMINAAAASHIHDEILYTANFNTGWEVHSTTNYIHRIHVLNKLIVLTGFVKRTSGTATTIFVLPYRPYSRRAFAVWGSVKQNQTLCRVDIYTNGSVAVISPDINIDTCDWISLDGIAYFAQ